jgi:hypothetical protein
MKIAGNKRKGIKSFTAIIILVLMVLPACTAQPTAEAKPISTATLIQPTQILIPTETATASPTETPTASPPIAGPDSPYPTEIQTTQTFDADIFAQQEQDFQTEILPKEYLGAKKIMGAYQALADNVTTQTGDVITIHGLYEKATRNWNIFAWNTTTHQALAVYLNGQIVVDFGGAVEIFKSKDLAGLTLEYLPPPAFAPVNPDDPAVPQFVASYGISQHNKWNILHAYDVDGNEIAWLNTTLNNGTWIDSNTGAPLPKFEPKGKVAGRFELPKIPLTSTGEFDYKQVDAYPTPPLDQLTVTNAVQWADYYAAYFKATFAHLTKNPTNEGFWKFGGNAELTHRMLYYGEMPDPSSDQAQIVGVTRLPALKNKTTGIQSPELFIVYMMSDGNIYPMALSTWANSAGRFARGNINAGGDFVVFNVFSFESINSPTPTLMDGVPMVGSELNNWETTRKMFLSGMLTEAQIRAAWDWAETIENGGRSTKLPKRPKGTLPTADFGFYQ